MIEVLLFFVIRRLITLLVVFTSVAALVSYSSKSVLDFKFESMRAQ